MPRKANGESSIYQDANGTWHGKVSMGLKDNGERDRRHVTGRRRADVLRKNRVLEQQREAGMAAAAGRSPTVGFWLDHWLNTIAVRRVRPSTFTRYEQLVLLHLIPGLGHHRLDRLQPEHVEALYGRMHDSGQAPASVLQAHRVLSRALKVAMQRGRVARNVATLVDAPSMVRERPVPLTVEEARRVLAVAVGTRNAARWSVALAVGLRQGEALGLQWSSIDLTIGTLRTPLALQRQKGKGLVLGEPKSRMAKTRMITLPPTLWEALKAHRKAQLAERLAAGESWEDNDFVFAQPNGRPLDPRGDNRAWMALLASAGVRVARLHDARHTAATLLYAQGVPPLVVSEIMAHSQVYFTQQTYGNGTPELRREAAASMDQALWGQLQP